MRVRAKEVCFVGGARRRKGAVFNVTSLSEGKNLPKFLEEVSDPVTEAEVIPANVPGQAPRPGMPVDDSEQLGGAPVQPQQPVAAPAAASPATPATPPAVPPASGDDQDFLS